jgi:SAM-dependent methyltransferase
MWNGGSRIAQQLDGDEEHFRAYTARSLATYFSVADSKSAPVIYDPACSTGTFLAEIHKALPQARCIGSDLSPQMVARASRKLSRVFVADALTCPLPDGSVDVLILRFLNSEVVKADQSLVLFEALQRLVPTGGRIIAFGHTPLVLPVGRAAAQHGLALSSRIGVDRSGPGLFQYYVLTRPSAQGVRARS